MSFLFKNRSVRQFKFKPVYFNSDKEEEKNKNEFSLVGKNYSKDMYSRYDRIPFSELEKRGKKKAKLLFYIAGLFALIIYYNYEKIIDFFTKG